MTIDPDTYQVSIGGGNLVTLSRLSSPCFHTLRSSKHFLPCIPEIECCFRAWPHHTLSRLISVYSLLLVSSSSGHSPPPVQSIEYIQFFFLTPLSRVRRCVPVVHIFDLVFELGEMRP